MKVNENPQVVIGVAPETTPLVKTTEEKTKCSVNRILNYNLSIIGFGFLGCLLGRVVGGLGNNPLGPTIVGTIVGAMGGFLFYSKRDN